MIRLFLAGMLLLGWAIPDSLAAAGPKFSARLLDVDLGRVGPDSLNKFTFDFKNVGDAPLIIERVRANCSCTQVRLSHKVLVPGASGRLEGTLKTTAPQGKMSRLIHLITNDPGDGEVILTIKADVRGDIDWAPQGLHLAWPVPEPYQGRIVLTPAPGEKVVCHRVDSEQKMLQPTLGKEGDRWVVDFKLLPGADFHYSDTLRIETSSRDFPTIRVPVFFQRKSQLKVTPSSCFFSLESGVEAPAKRFVIARKDGGELSLKAAEARPDHFLVNVIQRRGKAVVIEVRPKPGLPPGNCDGSIQVRTDTEELRLGISCQVNASEPSAPKG